MQAFNLEIADKEFIVLVGPSGCGKSTTLRMVAGLEEITEGKLYIGERLMNNIAPKDRDIAMVFQNYARYPHMTVYEKMAFALKLRKTPKAEIESKVREPRVLLMDEPLSNLDAKLRNQMRAELIKLRHRISTTFLYITHDQTEAMTLGDRIVIMKDGFIQQIGTPQAVFNRPATLFVAGFIGSPQMNFFPQAQKSPFLRSISTCLTAKRSRVCWYKRVYYTQEGCCKCCNSPLVIIKHRSFAQYQHIVTLSKKKGLQRDASTLFCYFCCLHGGLTVGRRRCKAVEDGDHLRSGGSAFGAEGVGGSA